jgi:hypothetical protein
MAEINKSVKAKGDLNLSNMSIIERDKNGDMIGIQYLSKLLADLDGETVTLSVSKKEEIVPEELE